MAGTKTLRHVKFEVYGRVQHVFMRAYTVKAGAFFGITGFVMNTENHSLHPKSEGVQGKVTASVSGEACGSQAQVENFICWLRGKYVMDGKRPVHGGPPPKGSSKKPYYPKLARIDALEILSSNEVEESPFKK